MTSRHLVQHTSGCQLTAHMIDAPRQTGHDPEPVRVLDAPINPKRVAQPVTLIDATRHLIDMGQGPTGPRSTARLSDSSRTCRLNGRSKAVRQLRGAEAVAPPLSVDL